MLELRNIVKKYGSGENEVTALRGISISFRQNEFVAILGHSGCGKTTLLNIIGGLDKYTSGDLIINGRSTKEYKDKDWDAYRNHSIGFIFQSYNLIPHQNVLANVELALTVSGVSKAERTRRAKEALERVGLSDQLYKRPSQMSGGQMQRVAIARALVNDPDILLADEPTGALDTENSIQVMEILKEIARDKLVILVTHNPELAEGYSTRIVRIKDGEITSDSSPVTSEEEEEQASTKKHVSMSFLTAVSLSLNNLMTKKGRTFLTAFAGSIGIIGIALILSLSTGINDYINGIQEETLSSYPLQIRREEADTGAILSSLMNDEDKEEEHTDKSRMYSNTQSLEMFNTMNNIAMQRNNMKAFKEFLDTDSRVQSNASAIKYSYNSGMQLYTRDIAGKVIKCDLSDIYFDAWGVDMSAVPAMSSSMTAFSDMSLLNEFISEGTEVSQIEKDRFELIHGSWPSAPNEVVLILSQNNEMPDIVLYTLGYKDSSKVGELMKRVMNGETIEDHGQVEWSFEDAMDHSFKVVLPCEKYTRDGDGPYTDMTETDAGMELMYGSPDIGTKLDIVGIVRPTGDSSIEGSNGYIGYTSALTDLLMEKTANSDIVKAQLADKSVDAITALPFEPEGYTAPSVEEKAEKFVFYLDTVDTAEKAKIYRSLAAVPTDEEVDGAVDMMMRSYDRSQVEKMISQGYAEQMGISSETISEYLTEMDDDTLMEYMREAMAENYRAQYAERMKRQLEEMDDEELAAELDMTVFSDEQYAAGYDEFIPDEFSRSTYDDVMSKLAYSTEDDPSSIMIYAKTFAQKDEITAAISDYNDRASEEDEIHYTDYVALLMSSITDIISGISYLLIAFVAISLVVSSIMIGIITYISVLERTREIGILRAIGASKRDISRVFNAETLIVGFTSGALGILVSALALIPINAILYSLTELEGLKAVLPWKASLILVAISMALTLIAGLIPSGLAAKKDPVEALRTE
ncbi:MAG: ABC transporter ATP-binding protein/permease [Oscillospiraceae bacterium]|nr:ABC transporter ATP-binding protein/permease [Oscillospiraceae bacterium]